MMPTQSSPVVDAEVQNLIDIIEKNCVIFPWQQPLIERAVADLIFAAFAELTIQHDVVAVPYGWKLVPVNPTKEMIDAAADGDRAYTLRNFGAGTVVMQGPEDHYTAMLAASPAHPKQHPTGVRCHNDECCGGQLPCPTPQFCNIKI